MFHFGPNEIDPFERERLRIRSQIKTRDSADALIRSIDKSTNLVYREAGSPRRVVVRSPRVPQGLARRGCSESEVKAAFLRLSASRIGCSTRDSTTSEQPPKHHEAILHSHIFLIAGIGRFRARGVNPGSCHQLLGG